jgi:hypothetical protein
MNDSVLSYSLSKCIQYYCDHVLSVYIFALYNLWHLFSSLNIGTKEDTFYVFAQMNLYLVGVTLKINISGKGEV